MSTSTALGFVGGAIGFWIGGPTGAQIGFALGSAVGGYVDPEQVFGPRLQDATVQTSRVGIPIPFGWGTFPVAGNLLWAGPITEHENTERQGKGGPEQVTYTYTRSYAIGLCQGMLREDGLYDPIAAIVMVKRNGKVVYDARTDAELEEEWNAGGGIPGQVLSQWIAHQRGASASFISKATFYLGSETQLPDPTMEMHLGAGNVPAYPGLVYMVVDEDDVAETAGAIPQYEVVVATGGTVTSTGELTVGAAASHEITVDAANIYFVSTHATGNSLFVGHRTEPGGYLTEYLGSDLEASTSGSVAILDADAVAPRAMSSGGWSIVLGSSANTMYLLYAGAVAAKLRPSDAYTAGWWGGEEDFDPEGSGLIFFQSGSVYVGVREVDSGVHNRIYRWDLDDVDGEFLDAGDTSPVLTSGSLFFLHVTRDTRVFALTADESELIELNSSLSVVETRTWPHSTTGINAIGVDGDVLFVLRSGTVEVYDLDTLTLLTSAAVASSSGANFKFSFTTDSIYVQSGKKIERIPYDPACLTYIPEGWNALPDAPDAVVSEEGTLRLLCGATDVVDRDTVVLGTIVAGLMRRVGIPSTAYDVSQLTDLVEGVRFANVSGPDLMIESLRQAYHFDKDERDGKLYWVKRGGDPVASIGPDDLVEREGDAIEWTRVQEAELLRKSSVTYLDPLANWAPNTQTAERRVSTVQAKGEAVFEAPICATSDEAARMVDRTLKSSWGEPEKCKFSLSLAWSELSTTDPIWLTDKAGEVHHVRLMQIEEDSGVLLCEGTKTRQNIYVSNVSGVRPPPPRVTTPGLIGPTRLVVMDLPVLRDADDKLGVYVAGRGVLSGWGGAAVYLSTDGGVSGGIVANITQASVIGYTTSALVADAASEYPSGQTLQVWLPSSPSSVTYATLLRYNNRAALQLDSGEWEVLQYQAVTDDGDGLYTLSGIVRGRYATTPGAGAAGNTFVLLDASVQFVECERWMVGDTDMQVKAVSFGTNPDATAYTDFDFTTPASQTEWPPYMVTAERDGSDNVTVTGYVRARLGTEVAPFHSQYFAGVRITYSDGETFDVTPNATTGFFTHTRSSAPASQTITAAALNTITGAGQPSEEVTA